MNIRDLLIEEIWLGGAIHVATVDGAETKMCWSGELHPGMEESLKGSDGVFPEWFTREVVAIGASKDGCLMIAVE